MEKFAKYLTAFNGKTEWEQVRPLFDDLFHPDCVFVTAEGELNKEQWAKMSEGLASKSAIASDFEVTEVKGDSIYYKVTISVGQDEPLHLTSKGTVKNGQLIRVEPVDPAMYSTMVMLSK